MMSKKNNEFIISLVEINGFLDDISILNVNTFCWTEVILNGLSK
jgi:hypothetical protein